MNQKMDTDNEDYYEEEYGGISSKNLITAVICISIFGFALIASIQQNPGPSVIAATQEGENLVIELKDVTPKARFYYHEVDNIKVRFFAVLGTDDQPHIAIDACDSCYAAKLGYTHANPYMKCNNCGRTFLITSIGTENLLGGCWPSYLPITFDDGRILVKVSDVESKTFMFA